MHPILERQIAKITRQSADGNPNIDALAEIISQTYDEFDKQYERIKSAFDVVNNEYNDLKQKIENNALAKVERSEKKFRTLYEASSDAVMMLDSSGFLDCNKTTLEMFGILNKEEFCSLHPSDISPEHQPCGSLSKDLANEKIKLALENGYNRFDWVHKRKNGEEFYAEVLLSSFTLEDGNILQAVVRDITKRKQLEEELRKAKENAELESKMKSHFLANMSHELRTPVHGIFGFSELLKSSPLSNEQRAMINNLSHSAKNLLEVINNVLQLASLDSEKVSLQSSPYSIKKIMEKILDDYKGQAELKELALYVKIPEEDIVYDCDNEKISQILNNLISNAIKFTDKGKILISAKALYDDDSKTKWRFEVEDTGIGISKDIQKNLFTPFKQGDISYTKKHQGTGLGLAICKKLADILETNLVLESEIDIGTKVYFDIELDKSKTITIVQEAQELKQATETFDFSGKKILIVEDNKLNQMLAKSFLDKVHAVSDIAENGEIGFEKFCNANYDLVLMDIHMPIMDGYTCAKKIRELQNEKAKVPIVALTANVMEQEKASCSEAGMDAYLSKPVDMKKFYQTLDKFLKSTDLLKLN